MTKSSLRAEELDELLTFFFLKSIYLSYVYVHVLHFPFLLGKLHLLLVSVYLWRSEDSSAGLVLSLHHVGLEIKLSLSGFMASSLSH